jgi:uncharacterized protein
MEITTLLKDKRVELLRLAEQHGARDVRLFGSCARGTAGESSDIDILVVLDPGRSLLDLVALKQDLEDLLGRQVHVVTRFSLSPYIRDSVIEEAVSL